LIGSVNQPAIFELKTGETINDLLQMAGGFATVADTTRLAIERLDERNTVRITQIELPQGQGTLLSNGDVLRAFNSTSVALPIQRQNKRVRVEGEVARPGEFVLPPQTTVSDALRAAGGVTPAAFMFGTEFSRESVRITQQENYERALRDLETEFAKATSTQRTSTADEAAAQTARASGTTRLIERLRAIKPTGRVVLQLRPESTDLPELALEDGDRLYIPPRPTTVGVFGSVFNGGSYLYSSSRSIDDYLNLAGGPTRGADQTSVFVIRANGSVVSSPQGKSWFSSKQDLTTVKAEPGDTVFVPEEINKTTFVQDVKDWTQILYQFGLGLAGFKAVGAF
jgi:protein involved in polysaccharide export with SLBB domain